MGSSFLMYVIPMMLGSTYDLRKDQPGVQIFPKSAIDKAMKIENHYTDSQYRMVENVEQIKNFLDIDGRMSLKIKAGLVNVGGEGKYLKDSSSKANGLEILFKVHFETITKTLSSRYSPNPGWSLINSKVLGTHYCRSITFGGDLVASVRISGSSKSDLQKIKGAFQGGVHTKGDGFALDLKGKLELLKQAGQDGSSIEIEYYASVPLNGISHTVEGLIKLVDQFADHVKKVNGGIGNPIKMELYPLQSLMADYPPYLENRALADELEDLEAHFDDLRETRRQLQLWVATLPPDIPEKINKKIEEFSTKIKKIYGAYLLAITELNVAKGASIEPINGAFEAYKDGEYILPRKYSRKLKSLQNTIYREAPELEPKFGGAHFVLWGKKKCPSEAETASTGVMIGSVPDDKGGSSDFLCSQQMPVDVDSQNYFGQHQDKQQDHLLLTTLRYRGTLQKFRSMLDKNIACSHCRLNRRTSVLVQPGRTSCPENWTKEYEGYLFGPGVRSKKGQYICIDKDMEETSGDVSISNVQNSVPLELKEVAVKCGVLPCNSYEDSKIVPCVVCSI